MPKRVPLNPEDYIVPLNMNGLQGRMLYLPPPKGKTRQMLMLYGLHASIERLFGMAEDLNKYGGVTLPDLPGFGGMTSYYHIGEKPTLDNLADYLAAFIKLRYKRRKVTIIAMSFSFVITTRMLQRYPELADRVELLISVVGFVHNEDFMYSGAKRAGFHTLAAVFSQRLPGWFAQHVILRPFAIKTSYRLVAGRHAKLMDADTEERNKRINFEVVLWQINDIRTYFDTFITMVKLDLCNAPVKLPVYHIGVADDHYFDNQLVEQHLNVIYDKVEVIISKTPAHAPTIVADAKAAAPFIPRKIRTLLAH
ncbi:MAG TPA: alpha/beta hydrolase [Candidatus Saccharimonadales bacterium]|nr:alpha/beta hydrolase [Candidatus Saccharimonadales bacterium]